MSRHPIRSSVRTDADRAAGSRAAEDLREALSRWVTGVTVVAARDADGRLHGLTVTAFLPLSVEPPLVAVAIGEHAPLLSPLVDTGRFTVNLLSGAQKRTANAFADVFPVGGGKFSEGDPVLEGALASLVCAVREIHPAGDHRLVVGAVERVELGEDAASLVYHRRAYGALEE